MQALHWELSVLSRAVGFPNLSGAADNIGLSQPQLSRIVARLEDELEIVLLDRSSRRKSGWTPAAHRLADTYARAATALEKELRAISSEGRPDHLRVGTLEGLAGLAASFCREIQRRCEVRTIELDVHDVHHLEEHYLKGAYDLIFVSRVPGRRKPAHERVLGFQSLEAVGDGKGPLVLSSFELQARKDSSGRAIDVQGAERVLVSNSLAVRKRWLEGGEGRGVLPSEVRAREGDGGRPVLLIGSDLLSPRLWKELASIRAMR